MISSKRETGLPKSPSSDLAAHVVITKEHVAVLEPAVPALESILEYQSRQFETRGPNGYREVETSIFQWSYDIKGRMAFPAGLMRRALRVLQELGYQVTIDDQRQHDSRLQIDHYARPHLDAKYLPLLDAIGREPLGQIEVASQDHAIEILALLGRAFPQARFLVAVPTKQQASALWHGLEKEFEEKIGLSTSGVSRRGDHWLVGIIGGIRKDLVGRADILLLPYAEQSLGDRAMAMRFALNFKRVYAFVQHQRRTDRMIQLRLEQMAGPVIHHLTKPRVPVRVVVLPTLMCAVTGGTTPLKRKRKLYWYNAVRNQLIAHVARAVVDNDRGALRELGLRHKDMKALRTTRSRVAIVVETPEHARQLLSLLPNWPVLDMVLPQTQAMPIRLPAIVTGAFAAKNDIKAGVVLRATGTEWPLRMKQFPPQAEDGTPDEVLLFDFVDEFDTNASRETDRRLQDYQRQGLNVVMVDGDE